MTPEQITQRAKELLTVNMEMLHSYPEGKAHCSYCNKFRPHANFDEECPALLRAAIGLAEESGAAREREECATLAENEIRAWQRIDYHESKEPSIETARVIAKAIRARGAESKP